MREVFGVSATAAVYRRAALRAVARRRRDLRLRGWAPTTRTSTSPCRLRAAGFRALLVPVARARHAGSLTGRTLSRERWRLIYGNRWRVARPPSGERLLAAGSPSWPSRDGVDLGRALLRGDGELAAGIVAGWGRALQTAAITSAHGRSPLLTGVVVHWRNEDLLAELAAAWPRDPRFELLVVDNGSSAPLPAGVRVLRPGRNLGFAGGANLGSRRHGGRSC